ncbi:MAG: MFS transporter [Bryobacteraceae bacterium]
MTASSALRRRWFYLLPAVFVTYSLAYVDRANYGFGAAAGLASTLHITGQQTSLLGALFFLGYFAFQVPGAALARKRSATWLIFSALIAWGVFASLTGVIRQFWLLAIDRLLLGVAESVILPASLLLLTRWFTRSERSFANTILILGNPITVLWMSAITGYLIQDFGWQMAFIIEGLPSVIWAFGWIAIARDKPEQARWVTADAAATLDTQLAKEQLAVAPVRNVRQALLRGDMLLLSAQYFLWSLGVYGFVLWLPTIVRQGSALSMGKTGLLTAVPYLFAVLAMIVVSRYSDRTLRRSSFVWPSLLIAGLALLGSFLASESGFALAFVCLVVAAAGMYAPYGPFFAIIPERVPRNAAAEAIALINSCGALGGFAGSYLVGLLQFLTGNPRAGYLLMSLSLVASAVLLMFLRKQPERRGT